MKPAILRSTLAVLSAAACVVQSPVALPAQAQQSSVPNPPRAEPQPASGRSFMSPMGESFDATAGGSGMEAWFKQADRDANGQISWPEMQQDADRFFKTLDVRHDGEIDPDDIQRYEDAVAPSARVSTTDSVIIMHQPITSADYNLNRGVSPSEFGRAALDRFRLVDTNHDSRLTMPELEILLAANTGYREKRKRSNNSSDEVTQSPVTRAGSGY